MIHRSALLIGVSLAACTQTAAPTGGQGDPGHGHEIAATRCQSCHGGDGEAAQPGVPSLGEQWPEYIIKQLVAFAAPPGAPNRRESATMDPIARGLTSTDIADVAAFYSLQWRARAGPRNLKSALAGREIYRHGDVANDLPACASCHRPSGLGIRPDFPNIAGQDPVYVERELDTWDMTRKHRGKLMSIIVERVRPEQRAPLAEYLASLESRPIEGRD